MNLQITFFFIILQFIKIFSEETESLLFEDYWQRKNIHFRSLSENTAPKISVEDMPIYEAFVQRCMQGHKNSLLIYTDHKKTTFHCSDNSKELKNTTENDRKKYAEELKAIAKFVKQGNIITFRNLGKKGANCSMQAEVDPNWENIEPIILGYQLKALAEELKSGDFVIAGCRVHIIHFDAQGNIDQSTY
ncbi:hypothetical protein HYV10_00920 [Candidatus Dependentiae bacterium]|nr:hypothetical protein [Candidatus Dependentiae bacterium]